MTQQAYPPQYPQYAAQQQFPPQQPYPPQYPAYPPQGYTQPYGQPPAQPAAPLAQGSIDDYYNQPSAGSGPSISWSNPDKSPKPIGTAYAGVVARPVTNADIQQQTDPATQQPKFFRDGRPMFVMTVPLKVQPSPEFPNGEATWFVRGQARDELVRAMAEAGAPSGPPEHGAYVAVTLVQRRPSRMGNPANIVQVQYTRPQGAVPAAPAGPEAGSPAPGPASPPVQQPAPAVSQPNTQPYPQPTAPQQAVQQPPQTWAGAPGTYPPASYTEVANGSVAASPAPGPQAPAYPPQAQAPVQQPAQAPVQQPAQAQPGTPQMPPDFTPEQQAVFARIAAQNAAAAQTPAQNG